MLLAKNYVEDGQKKAEHDVGDRIVVWKSRYADEAKKRGVASSKLNSIELCTTNLFVNPYEVELERPISPPRIHPINPPLLSCKSSYSNETMPRTFIARILRSAPRQCGTSRNFLSRGRAFPTIRSSVMYQTFRPITTSNKVGKGLSPESENPKPKILESNPEPKQAAELSQEQYNDLSDKYMDMMVEKLEELQEEREDVDVEYSVRFYFGLMRLL